MKHPVPDRIKLSFVIFDIWTLLCSRVRAERQSARMSKIMNDGLTWSGTGCFIAVPIWQQWASTGKLNRSKTPKHRLSGYQRLQ